MTEDQAAAVRRIIAEHLGIEELASVTDDKTLDELGADSLDQVEITMALEEHFNISIPEEDLDALPDGELVTVADVLALMKTKL